MASSEKEGENYLDTLLNTVAPDWEETSESPAQADSTDSESNQGDSSGDKTLEDAIAILNDLPDMDGALELSENPEEDMDELFGLLADLGVDPDEQEPEASGDEVPEAMLPDLDSIEGISDDMETEEIMADPVMTEDILADEGSEQEESQEVPQEEQEEQEEEPQVQEDDIPFSIDSFPEEESEEMQDFAGVDIPDVSEPSEESAEDVGVEESFIDMSADLFQDFSEEPQPEEEVSISEDSLAVDDIFQDALAAVGYSENEREEEGAGDDVFAMDDMGGLMDQEEEGVSSVPAAEPVVKKEKKKEKTGPGFFQKIFGNVITDSTADEEEKERQREAELKQKKEEKKAEKKQQAEVTKEEKAQIAQEKKEHKKQLKAEQAAKKAEEKKRKKEERLARAAQETEVVGKINPVGATIVVILFVTIGMIAILGTNMLGRRSNLGNAENYFANEDYIRAYDAINRVKLKEKDETLFRRIRICCQLQKEVRSFSNYNTMGMKLEALDSLLKGMRLYEENVSEAQELQIQPAYEKLKNELLAGLSENFSMGEKEVSELLAIPDQAQYTQRLQQITGA
ncbi:MAG: hypothetical protein HFG36_04655 [Eubacterium sp.]|nr:hypothetical protein [Eubacterium sp.]